jgi:hypothetical protein
MSFDRNPKSTPADVYIAGKTTEAIVRAILPAVGAQTVGTVAPGLLVVDVLGALVARFDRKAEARAAKEA